MRRVLSAIALLGAMFATAQRSPFNGLEVLPPDSTGRCRILIGGHFHGASTNRSGYPAATLLANLDTINKLGAHLFLSTGDLFMDPVKDRERYGRALFSKLGMPLFNAPGNHDADDDGRDELFRIHGHVVMVLDTEKGGGSLDGPRLDALNSILAEARSAHAEGRTMNVLVISHRPVWAEDDPQYSPLFKDNTRSLTGTNFPKDVYPLLERIAEHAHVYWISGSLGGNAPSSIFFHEHAPNITYIQCAIRDEPRDALLIADVYEDSVRWSAFSLTGQELLAPEAYDAGWWRERVEKPAAFNWRLLPHLVKNTVTHRAFRWGAFAGAALLFLLWRTFRRR